MAENESIIENDDGNDFEFESIYEDEEEEESLNSATLPINDFKLTIKKQIKNEAIEKTTNFQALKVINIIAFKLDIKNQLLNSNLFSGQRFV